MPFSKFNHYQAVNKQVELTRCPHAPSRRPFSGFRSWPSYIGKSPSRNRPSPPE